MIVVGFDVDGVIYKMELIQGYSPENFGELIPGAKECLQKLKDGGVFIIIYSCRTNPLFVGNEPHDLDELRNILKRKLDADGIPYHDIAVYKPICDVYVDDRAIRFNSWHQAMCDLNFLEKVVVNEHKPKS